MYLEILQHTMKNRNNLQDLIKDKTYQFLNLM